MNTVKNKAVVPEEVLKFIQETCGERGIHLIETYLRGNPARQIMEIFIDSEQGVTHEDCKVLSDRIDEQFEDTDFFDTVHSVEVSSPGADRPLKFPWQFSKHVDRTLECRLRDGSTVKGRLLSVEGNQITLRLDKTKKEIQEAKKLKLPLERSISFDELEQAVIVLKW